MAADATKGAYRTHDAGANPGAVPVKDLKRSWSCIKWEDPVTRAVESKPAHDTDSRDVASRQSRKYRTWQTVHGSRFGACHRPGVALYRDGDRDPER